VSEKMCDELVGFVTSPSSPNKAVCSTAAVQLKKGKGKAQCSGAVTYAAAQAMCDMRKARLCTADELSQDVGDDELCGYNNQRVWTSTECPFEGQMLTQAGASAFLHQVPKQCTDVDTPLPVYCCADQRAHAYFRNLEVVPGQDEISLSWNWQIYANAQVSVMKVTNSSKGEDATTWQTPAAGGKVKMGGDASIQLTALNAGTRYAIRITPMTKDNKLVKSQMVEFRASTL